MNYATSSDAALEYLAARVLNPSWVSQHDDVAYYFKSPLAFLEAGRQEEALKALAVAEQYVACGGINSANGVYAGVYPHYPWLWICWAANGLGRADLVEQCFQNFSAYIHPPTSSGLVNAPFSEEKAFEADFFATAELVKFALFRKDTVLAEHAGDMLLHVLEANRVHMPKGRFFLRWTSATMQETSLVEAEDVLHCVLQDTPGQLYFMMGFPIMTMLELSQHQATQDHAKVEAYASAVSEILAYLKGCVGIWESPMAHKVGRAAAMVGDQESAVKIADFLVSQQQSSGGFQADPDAMDSLDQTAEIAVWLRQIDQDLNAQAKN